MAIFGEEEGVPELGLWISIISGRDGGIVDLSKGAKGRGRGQQRGPSMTGYVRREASRKEPFFVFSFSLLQNRVQGGEDGS